MPARNDPLFPPLGDLIKDSREKMGYSLKYCASLLDISWQRLSAWERNKSMPSQRKAHAILDLLPWDRPLIEDAIWHYYEELNRDDNPYPWIEDNEYMEDDDYEDCET